MIGFGANANTAADAILLKLEIVPIMASSNFKILVKNISEKAVPEKYTIKDILQFLI